MFQFRMWFTPGTDAQHWSASGRNRAVAVVACILSLVVLLLLTAGCGSGGPDISYVSGRVTMDGKPLPNAAVVFIPENGRPAGARTDEDGNYVLNFSEGRRGAIPGKSTVRIMTEREAEQDENGKVILPAAPEIVPAKYNTASTLEFTVEPNKRNVANFDLNSK